MTALAIVVVLGVGFRKFGAALVWYDEVASVLLAWLTYYGAALAALKRAHIGFPNLVQGLRDTWRVPIVVVGEAIVIAFFLVAAWGGWRVLVILEGIEPGQPARSPHPADSVGHPRRRGAVRHRAALEHAGGPAGGWGSE